MSKKWSFALTYFTFVEEGADHETEGYRSYEIKQEEEEEESWFRVIE